MRINKRKLIALAFIVYAGLVSINSHSADKKKVNVNMSKYVYPPQVNSQYFTDLNDLDWIIKSFWDGALLSVAAPAIMEAYRHLFVNKLTKTHQLGAGSALAMLGVLSGALNARYQLLYGWNKKKGNANFNQGGWQKMDKGDGLIRYIIDDDNREVSKIAHIELWVNSAPGSCPLSEPAQLDDESMGAWLKCYLERREKPYLVIEKSSAQKKADPEPSVDRSERPTGELVGRKNVCLSSREKHCFTSRLLDLVNSIAADEQIYLFFDKDEHKPIELKLAIVREHNKEQNDPKNDSKKGKPDQITLSSSPLLTITREEWGDSIIFEDFILNRMPVFKEEDKIWSCDIGDKSNYMGSYGDKLFPDCFAGMWDRKSVHGKNEKPRLVSVFNNLGFVTEMIAIFNKTGQVDHDFSRQYSLDESAYNHHKGNTVFPIPLEHVRVFNGQYVNLFDVGGLHCYQVPGLTGVPLRCVLGSQERQVFFNDHDEDEKNKAKMHDLLDLNTAWDSFYNERAEIRRYRKEYKSSDPVLGSAFYASKLSLWSLNNIVLPGYQLLRGIKDFENSYIQPIREAEKHYIVDPARAVVKAVVGGTLNGAIDGVVKGARAVVGLPFYALWGGGVLLKKGVTATFNATASMLSSIVSRPDTRTGNGSATNAANAANAENSPAPESSHEFMAEWAGYAVDHNNSRDDYSEAGQLSQQNGTADQLSQQQQPSLGDGLDHGLKGNEGNEGNEGDTGDGGDKGDYPEVSTIEDNSESPALEDADSVPTDASNLTTAADTFDEPQASRPEEAEDYRLAGEQDYEQGYEQDGERSDKPVHAPEKDDDGVTIEEEDG